MGLNEGWQVMLLLLTVSANTWDLTVTVVMVMMIAMVTVMMVTMVSVVKMAIITILI